MLELQKKMMQNYKFNKIFGKDTIIELFCFAFDNFHLDIKNILKSLLSCKL